MGPEVSEIIPAAPGILRLGKMVLTKNLTPGMDVYGEALIKKNGFEYREWNASRSKLCAAIKNGLKSNYLEIAKEANVLYLGASTGTTVSHISDVIGNEGTVFAVEMAPDVGRHLLLLAKQRHNIFPVIADASKPATYFPRIFPADVLYQDVAQRNQVEICIKNSELFLKQEGIVFLCIKSRSIDVTRKPKDIFIEVRKQLAEHFTIEQEIDLFPFQRDHRFYVMRKRLSQQQN